MVDMDSLLNIIYKQRFDIIKDNVHFLNNKLFLEFGVCNGGSLLNYYNLYNQFGIESSFYGFDSFQGLPAECKDPLTVWKTGEFSTGGFINPELLNKPKVKIINGWFSDTLTEDLYKEFNDRKVGILHMDCDTYSSTLEVLEFIIKHDLLVDGSIIVYDDWGAWRQAGLKEQNEYDLGEGRAHKEICSKYNLNFELISKSVPEPEFYEIAAFVYKPKNVTDQS